MSENSSIQILIPRGTIEQIARDVFSEMQPATVADPDAQATRAKIQRLMSKPFWSIAELAFVWGCSDGHVRNLLQRAEDNSTDSPVPFCNIDGLVMFERDVILEWTRTRRPLKRGVRKSGGKRTRGHLREVRRAS